ncbi:MAG: 50S ribosomal protein L9 [Treponema sp.]|nr:50S ribosomal protein L9 [Treponema sp.]
MKVILNADVKYLGEEGDVKVVANGYARNYLFPRNLALPYNDMTVAYFESRKEEIEAKKAEKRAASASIKEKLEAYTVTISMPAGPNGKLYGAVTNQTIADILNNDGFEIERKRVEVPGLTIKTLGKYTANVRLYEGTQATINVVVVNQDEKSDAAEEKSTKKPVEKTSEKTVEKPAEEKQNN